MNRLMKQALHVCATCRSPPQTPSPLSFLMVYEHWREKIYIMRKSNHSSLGVILEQTVNQ